MAIKNINAAEFEKMLEEGAGRLEIVDVREQGEFDQVRIKDSKLIPLDGIEKHMEEIDWKKKVILVCRSGARSGYASRLLDSHGKDVVNLQGGICDLETIACDCLERKAVC